MNNVCLTTIDQSPFIPTSKRLASPATADLWDPLDNAINMVDRVNVAKGLLANSVSDVQLVLRETNARNVIVTYVEQCRAESASRFVSAR